MSAIARELGLSVSRVSRLIARAEEAKEKACPPRLVLNSIPTYRAIPLDCNYIVVTIAAWII